MDSMQSVMINTENILAFVCCVKKIYYEANSRGFTLSCKVENQILFTSKERDFKEYSEKIKISDDDWAAILELTKKVDLEKVKDMKWPTEKRYYDGAAHANIIFELNNIKTGKSRSW